MSIVSTTHDFVPLTKDSKAMHNQRLVRLISKTSRSGEKPVNLSESLCVSIPHLSDESIVNNIEKLIPHIVRMCKDAQDQIIREYRIESGKDSIHESVFDIGAVIGYLDSNATGDRVSKEYLAEWFTDEYGSIATQWINTISGGGLSEDVLAQKTNIIRDLVAGFASPKFSPAIPALKAVGRFITHCTDNEVADTRLIAIGAHAAALLKKKEEELSVDALGF